MDVIGKPLSLAVDMAGCPNRCEAFGGQFRFFIHAGSCDGENRRLYPIRIRKEHIPPELIPFYWNFEQLLTEQELWEKLKDDPGHAEHHVGEELVLYVSNTYDVFFNFTHMRPEWRIGNLKTDPVGELIRAAVGEDTPALRAAREITLGELVRRYGDRTSTRVFFPEDHRDWLLNGWLEERALRGA